MSYSKLYAKALDIWKLTINLDFSKKDMAPNFPEIKVYKSSVIRFMHYFFAELLDTKVRIHWRNFDEYFECLRDFTKSSFLATSFMI